MTFTVLPLTALFLAALAADNATGPLLPTLPSFEDYDCGTKPFVDLPFLSPGMRAYGETVPEGNIQIIGGNCTGCRNLRFKSGALNLDGQVHTVSMTTLASYGESLLRGSSLLIEAAFPLPTDANGDSLLVDDDLFLSIGVASDKNYTMWEYEPMLVTRDGDFQLLEFAWKQPLWRRMYQNCQSLGEAGWCMKKTECAAFGGTSVPSAGITDKTFKTSGCHRFNNTQVQCCINSNNYLDAYDQEPPVNATAGNTVFALRLANGDTTSTLQTVVLKAISICSDPCNGFCDATEGMTCDVSTKTCQCQNQYPWVRGPDGKCYFVESGAGPASYPCKQCPRSSMFTYYDNDKPKLGVDRLECVPTSVVANSTAKAQESCCGYECRCASGFAESSGIPLTPNIKYCEAISGGMTTSANKCAYECDLPMICQKSGFCGCDESKGWVNDPTVAIPFRPRCIRSCVNCAQPTICRASDSASACVCLDGYVGQMAANGLLSCSKPCLTPCVAPKICAPTGTCACPVGRVPDASGNCVSIATSSTEGGTRPTLFGCGAPCGEREECDMTTNKCECRDIYTRNGTDCVDQCDACRARLQRATCTGPLPTDCTCASTLVEMNGACVPKAEFRPTTTAPAATDFFANIGISSDKVVIIVGAVVGGVICLLILIGVLVCVCCVCMTRRQTDQTSTGRSMNDVAREGNPLYLGNSVSAHPQNYPTSDYASSGNGTIAFDLSDKVAY